MSNLGDLLDDYEPERLAKLAADDLITKARREAMPQDVADRVDGVNAMIDEEALEEGRVEHMVHMEEEYREGYEDR